MKHTYGHSPKCRFLKQFEWASQMKASAFTKGVPPDLIKTCGEAICLPFVLRQWEASTLVNFPQSASPFVHLRLSGQVECSSLAFIFLPGFYKNSAILESRQYPSPSFSFILSKGNYSPQNTLTLPGWARHNYCTGAKMQNLIANVNRNKGFHGKQTLLSILKVQHQSHSWAIKMSIYDTFVFYWYIWKS